MSAVTCRSPMRIARSQDGGRRAVETYDIATVLIELDNGASGRDRAQPLGLGAQGPHLSSRSSARRAPSSFDQERMNEVQLYTADERRKRKGSAPSWPRPQHPALRQIHPGAGPWARLQRSQDHRVPRTDRPHARRARVADRLRGWHPNRANRRRDGAQRPGGRVGRGGLTPPVIPGREASPEPILQTVSRQSVERNALSGIVSASGFRAPLLRPRNDGVLKRRAAG